MDFNELFENGFDNSLTRLFRRTCVECPPEPPSCPVCVPGKVCVQKSRTCKHCASRSCVLDSQSGATQGLINTGNNSSGPNIGAIAGGVIGGVIFISLATWLVWRYCIKTRREEWEDDYEDGYEPYAEKVSTGYDPSPNPNTAASIRTRQSYASTSFTRDSNVIKIAFVPGVQGREDESFIPPVPPIPAASPAPGSPQTPYSDYNEDHYFMPSDLRDSAYSGFTDDATSTFTRQSVAPSIAPSLLRQSVASTIYRDDGVENPLPAAQTAQRGRPLMVSVKSSANTSRSGSMVPAVPYVDHSKYSQTDSINSASSPLSPLAVSSPDRGNTTANESSSSVSTVRPERNASTGPTTRASQPDLKFAIAEATRQASRQPVHGGLGAVRREPSPFSDDNRIPSNGSTPPAEF